MKRLFTALLLLLLLIAMLLSPGQVFSGASEGLLLWFHTVLPTLFPFLLITSLLTDTSSLELLSRPLTPLTRRLFGVSGEGAFVVLGGFLCGYPMGARLTAELMQKGRLSPAEGNYLLSFCNNTSPMFVLSYLAARNLKRPALGAVSLLILTGSAVLCSLFFRRFWRAAPSASSSAGPILQSTRLSFAQALDESVIKSCDAITRIGGYIIAFSILTRLLATLLPARSFWGLLLLSSLEMTGGIPLLVHSGLPFAAVYPLVMALTSFGGFCAVFQTRCMIGGQPLSLAAYTIEKLVTALVASLFSILYLQLF